MSDTNTPRLRHTSRVKSKGSDLVQLFTRASQASGGHFALLWIDVSDGNVKVFGSDSFKPKLDEWFSAAVLDEAKAIVNGTGVSEPEMKNDDSMEVEMVDHDAGMEETSTECVDESMDQFDILEEQEMGDEGRDDDDDYELPVPIQRRPFAGETIGQDYPSLNRSPTSHNIAGGIAGGIGSIASPSRSIYGSSQSFRSPPTHIQPLLSSTLPNHLVRSLSCTSTFANRILSPAFDHLHPLPPFPNSPSASHFGTIDQHNLTAFEPRRPLSHEKEIVFTPASLTLWFLDKFAALQQKTSKMICKAWIMAIDPHHSDKDEQPVWWPKECVRHRDPDKLMKTERNTLSMRLLRYSNVPVAAYEASTLSIEQFITISKLAILKDIYNVARTEQAAIACSPDGRIDSLTVFLPKISHVGSSLSSSSPDKTIGASMRRSATISGIDDRHRSPYSRPIPRNTFSPQLTSRVLPPAARYNDLGSPVSLSRSQSLNEYREYELKDEATSVPGGVTRRKARHQSRKSFGLQIHLDDQAPPLSHEDDSVESPPEHHAALYNHPDSISSLQPPFLLRSTSSPQNLHLSQPLSTLPFTQQTTPAAYEDSGYPSSISQRLYQSTSSAPVHRPISSSIDPSFASPAMIRSSSRPSRLSGGSGGVGAAGRGMGPIQEAVTHEEDVHYSASTSYHQLEPIQVHPDHQLDSISYNNMYLSPDEIVAPQAQLPQQLSATVFPLPTSPYITLFEQQQRHSELERHTLAFDKSQQMTDYLLDQRRQQLCNRSVVNGLATPEILDSPYYSPGDEEVLQNGYTEFTFGSHPLLSEVDQLDQYEPYSGFEEGNAFGITGC